MPPMMHSESRFSPNEQQNSVSNSIRELSLEGKLDWPISSWHQHRELYGSTGMSGDYSLSLCLSVEFPIEWNISVEWP